MVADPVVVVRGCSDVRDFLARFGSRRRRVIWALLVALAAGPAFAAMAHRIEYFSRRPVLEYDPGTVYISCYLGQPDEEETIEADPADAPSQPNLDRFYRVIAQRVKTLISDEHARHYACIRGLGACDGDFGWPFRSRGVSFLVDAYVIDPNDGEETRGYRFRAGEDGLDPERPWG